MLFEFLFATLIGSLIINGLLVITNRLGITEGLMLSYGESVLLMVVLYFITKIIGFILFIPTVDAKAEGKNMSVLLFAFTNIVLTTVVCFYVCRNFGMFEDFSQTMIIFIFALFNFLRVAQEVLRQPKPRAANAVKE